MTSQKRSRSQFYALRDAAESDFAVAAALIENDPAVLEARSSTGETAFHYLVIENRIEIAEWLLDRGSDINTRDKFGDTPLSSSAVLGYLPMCQMLLSRGANLKTKNDNDDTPISQATQGGNVAVLEFLLSQLEDGEDIQTYFDDITASFALREDSATTALLKKQGLVDPWA